MKSYKEVYMVNYIRLVYYKEDIVLYIKLQLFLEWIGFRVYEYRLETDENIMDDRENAKWEKNKTIFLYRSQMKEQLETVLEKETGESFVILCKKTDEFLENIHSVLYDIENGEIPYAGILEKIQPDLLNNGLNYIIEKYQIDMVRSMYTITRLYVNSKINYKKSELLEEAEKFIFKAIQELERLAKEEEFKLQNNLRFFFAINYLKDLQNAKRKLFQEELVWSSQEIVDSLNRLLEEEVDFKSCYLLKVSACEKKLVLSLSELPIFNLESGQDELDYVAQYKLGVFYQNNLLDDKRALEQYEKCFSTNPKYYRNLYKLAFYYKSNENYKMALEIFLRILENMKEKDDIYWEIEKFEYYYKIQYFIARIYWETGEYLSANLAYQKAFQIWSDLKRNKVVKELYRKKEDNIKAFMQNKYCLEEKRQSIMNEIGLSLESLKW